jgi:LPXTG-site transpeptidase (sortase) family protein
VDSAKPGDAGLSIIDGHVSSRYGSALFAKLGQLAKGDFVQVQFGDNSIRRFQVIERRELSEKKSASFLFAKKEGIERQLNIITCGGFFNTSRDQYSDRVVVVTKFIG